MGIDGEYACRGSHKPAATKQTGDMYKVGASLKPTRLEPFGINHPVENNTPDISLARLILYSDNKQ